jgi:hypothetical protein
VGLIVGDNRRAARNDFFRTISAVDLVADGWAFECDPQRRQGGSPRTVDEPWNFGGPYRTARQAIITTLVGVLAAAPVSAFDIRPDKNLAGVTATNPDEETKELEAELAPLASDMWGTQKRLEEKGFRVDRGNKSATGWWLTANNRNTSRSLKVQSDGAKIVVTAEK